MNAEQAYLEGKLRKGGALYNVGLNIGDRILRDGRLHGNELWDQMQNVETIKTLLSKKVFVMVPCALWVVFQSKTIQHVPRERYDKSLAEENSRSVGGKEIVVDMRLLFHTTSLSVPMGKKL